MLAVQEGGGCWQNVLGCKCSHVNIIVAVPSMVLTLDPSFAGLLKELLKSNHFVSILMNNSNTEEESENPDFLEAENPLPLVLKKVIAEVIVNCQ